jgi:uncharacterized protein YecT (DUF1311 family)
MRLKILFLALTCLASATQPLFAQSQVQMTGEAGNKATQAEHRMEKVYADLMAKLSADSAKMLEAAQKTWRRFRDEECTFETRGTVGGTVHNMLLYACQADLTNARVAVLERQLNCQEGDMGCARR